MTNPSDDNGKKGEVPATASGGTNIDVMSPFFISTSDNPNTVFVSHLLRDGNYADWVDEMSNALFAKNKYGFVDGTISVPAEGGSELLVWRRCNAMVKGWLNSAMEKEIRNSVKHANTAQEIWEDLRERFGSEEIWEDLRERFGSESAPRAYELKRAIAMTRQEKLSVSAYYTKLKGLWDEIQSIAPIPKCKCSGCTCDTSKKLVEMRDREKLYEFLMGLDASFGTIKTQILGMKPAINLGMAYHLVSEDEKQKSITTAGKIEAEAEEKDPDDDEVEIVVQGIKLGETGDGREFSYTELYLVNLNKDRICKYLGGGGGGGGDRRLILGDKRTSMAALGHVIYILGGIEYRQMKNPLPRDDYGYFHCKVSHTDLFVGNRWNSAPHYRSLSRAPECVAFKGRLFIFGGYLDSEYQLESPGEVLDPKGKGKNKKKKKGKWTFLPSPPIDSTWIKTRGSHVSTPVLVDPAKNRIIVHFCNFNYLCAYYPDESKWEILLPPESCFRFWDNMVAVVDDMLIFHVAEMSTPYFQAFDLQAKKFLKCCLSLNFDSKLLCYFYEALIPLKTPGTLCLISDRFVFDLDNPIVTRLTFVKFRVERTPSPSGEDTALFTFISVNNHDIDAKCVVTNCVAIDPPLPLDSSSYQGN